MTAEVKVLKIILRVELYKIGDVIDIERTRTNLRTCREVVIKRITKGDCMEYKPMKKPKVIRVMRYCPECEALMNCRYY